MRKIFLTVVLALILTTVLPSGAKTSSSVARDIELFDPQEFPTLIAGVDTTPIHTIQLSDGTKFTPNSWGWEYDYTTEWLRSEQVNVNPLGLVYKDGSLFFREWASNWGAPGDLMVLDISEQDTATYPLKVYNIVGNRAVRSYVNVSVSGVQVFLKTDQVAIAYLVPADVILNESVAELPAPSKLTSFGLEFNCGRIEKLYLKKTGVFTTSDGWRTTSFKVERVAVRSIFESFVFPGSLNYLETSPSGAVVQKSFSDTWNPSRLIGKTLCSIENSVPMTALK